MQELDNLIDQYQRRVFNLKHVILYSKDAVYKYKLETKASCYRTFLVELERLKTQLNEESK